MPVSASDEGLSGPERAAILLLVLGEEHGAPIWSSLDDEELRLVTSAISRLGAVKSDVVDSIIQDLISQFGSLNIHGDVQTAQSILKNVLPSDRLNPLLADLGAPAGRTIWQRLANVRENVLANYVKNEHPQVVALIMTRIKPIQAASVLALLPDDFAAEVMFRMISIENVTREIIEVVEENLRVNFIANLAQNNRRDMHEILAEVFNAMDSSAEQRLMEALRSTNELAAEKVRDAMFTFEDLTKLDLNSAQTVLRTIDKSDLAKALKGSGAHVREYFTNKMTERSAKIFFEEMQSLGPIRLKEVDEAQQRIIAIVKMLDERNEIILPKGGEDDLMLD